MTAVETCVVTWLNPYLVFCDTFNNLCKIAFSSANYIIVIMYVILFLHTHLIIFKYVYEQLR